MDLVLSKKFPNFEKHPERTRQVQVLELKISHLDKMDGYILQDLVHSSCITRYLVGRGCGLGEARHSRRKDLEVNWSRNLKPGILNPWTFDYVYQNVFKVKKQITFLNNDTD